MQKNLILRTTLFLLIACNFIFAYSSDGKETLTSDNFQSTDTLQIIAESESFFKKGKLFYDKEEYAAAIDCFLKSDSVISVHFGTDCPYFGYGKKWTASCYHKQGMDSIALEYSIYYDKQPIDKLLTHSSDSVIWIALRLLDLGKIKNAAEKLSEAALLEKQELGSNNYWHVNTLSYCAGLYSEIGQFDKAIELGQYAVEFYKVNFGIEHPNYATCLANLSTIYLDSGNAFRAIELGKDAIEIKKRFWGNEYPGYADNLSNLAENYSSIGNYTEAIRLGEKAMNIRKRNLGTEHSDYAISLICVANYYAAIGDYPKAIRLGTEAMEIWKKVFGTNHPYYATSLYYLADYYSSLGEYSKALQLGTEAMNIRKEVLGVKDPHYVTSLSSLTLYKLDLGKYEDAIRIGKENLELTKHVFGIEHPNYAASLTNLSNCYYCLGNYTEAIQLANKALDIWRKVYGNEHRGYANILNNLAKQNAAIGNYIEAINLAKESNLILRRIFGTEHPDYALSLSNLASFYANIGNYTEAYNYIKLHIVSSQSYLLNNFVELPLKLRESLWTRRFALFYNSLLPSIVEKNKNRVSVSELYDKTCLFAKGILLNTDIEIRNLILESGDSVLIAQYDTLSSNISIYNKLIETPINKRFVNSDSLSIIIQQQKMELAQKSKVYGDYTHNLTISWKDVQSKLDDDDIAVEFLDFPILNADSTMYIALTLKKGYDSPRMITLFEKRQLNAIQENVYYTQTDVSDLVWKPLEGELKGVKNIYFSPSGELHRIGIEYLPISKTENICDVYTLHRLSSTRQLAVIQDETKGNNTILYGGINYDEKSNTVPVSSSTTKDPKLRSAFTYRANVDLLALRNSYDYLEGSKKEADLIAEDMKLHSVPYNYYSGADATEESFKMLDRTRPKMMHIATHGFYLTEIEAEKTKFARSGLGLLTDVDQRESLHFEHKSMTRSGLLFSGCNHIIHHEQIPDGEEDGILTAQEISTLDLRGLDLVVLSACQTGLGDVVSGEGVFGLQRGFKKAGAKTIIMSLWNVNDESTMKMMTSFYHHYLEGMPKNNAFRTAQDELRKDSSTQQERPDWAAFIMLDGLN